MLAAERRTVDVTVPLRDGRQLRGTVAGVHGTAVVSVGYSKLGPKPQLSVWIALLALAAAHPERPWTAVAVGRGQPGQPRAATFGPIDQATAKGYLEWLVDLYDRGLCEPLPLPLKTSLEYAGVLAKMEGQDEAAFRAGRVWTTGKYPGEDADASHALVWGSSAPFDKIFGGPPRADENWAGERTRLAELSLRLWGPLLQHRRMAAM
jgi:exodeoxyribonuclease V gamma subunit